MKVLALITQSDEIKPVLCWAAQYAKALGASLSVICWAYTPLTARPTDLSEHRTQSLGGKVRDFCTQCKEPHLTALLNDPERIEIIHSPHTRAARAAIELANEQDIELIVAAADDQTGHTGNSYASNELLRHSPCHTVILLGDTGRSLQPNRILVAATDSPHDSDALFLAGRLATTSDHARVTLARTETEDEPVVFEVGRRELRELMREAGVDQNTRYQCQVYSAADRFEITELLEDQDLVLVSPNNRSVSKILELSTRPTVAAIKRAPPLRTRRHLHRLHPWIQRQAGSAWSAQLSPADYADLLQGLRRGSKLNADFLTLLCLAAVVASMGLLQNSSAVVIGSMLLAPLMTPMLGYGLALAQANPSLGNTALRSVTAGLLCALTISFLLGLLTSSAELTREILARGNPNTLDLIVALASASAAAFALARPNLLGSIAGVAIATALLPPLCSAGLSLADGNFANAFGAALLFATNFVAIVLGAALTFRLMGVTASLDRNWRRRWTLRTATLLTLAAALFSIPLFLSLQHRLIESKPEPALFPLADTVQQALVHHIKQRPELELISAGQPSSPHDKADVVLIIGAPHELERDYASALAAIVRHEMQDQSLTVEVHCIRELWQQVIDPP